MTEGDFEISDNEDDSANKFSSNILCASAEASLKIHSNRVYDTSDDGTLCEAAESTNSKKLYKKINSPTLSSHKNRP